MSAFRQNVAFLGATGGSTLPALALSLEAGHLCRALARSPAKLTDQLRARGIPSSTIDNSLHIVKGDASHIDAVKSLLNFSTKAGQVELPDIIISGLGGKPTLQWDCARLFTMPQKRICAHAARSVVAALDSFSASSKSQQPIFCQIAAIGVEESYRDWPLLYWPITRWLLNGDIYEDKREAHKAALDAARSGLLRPISIRPATLLGGSGKGVSAVRVGLDDKPVVGWVIRKEDVGAWMYEKLINVKTESEREVFVGRNVNLAY